MQTSQIAVKSFVVLCGLQGNSSQVCDFKKTVKLFNTSIHTDVLLPLTRDTIPDGWLYL